MKFYTSDFFQTKINDIFNKLKNDLELILSEARIEHIGSTAIVGSISKGDLDVFVGVSEKNFKQSLDQIKELGFSEKLGTHRTESLCMLVTEKYHHDVAVQLVVNGTEFEDFVRFRDILNRSPDLVREYNELKKSSEGMESDAYREKKSVFIQKVLTLK